MVEDEIKVTAASCEPRCALFSPLSPGLLLFTLNKK